MSINDGCLNDGQNKCVLFLNEGLHPCSTGGIEIFHHFFIKAISKYFCGIVMTRCDHELGVANVMQISTRSPIGRLGTVFMILRHLRHIFSKRRKIGLIHIPYSSAQVFQFYHVMLLANWLGIPYVLRIHGGGMHPARPDFMHAAYFRRATGIITVSRPVKEEYERRYGKDIKLIPSYLPFLHSGMNKSGLRTELDIPQDRLVFLCLGTVKKIKGTDVLLDAVQHLGREYLENNRTVFVVVGGGDMEEQLRNRATELGLESVIQFKGGVPYEQVHKYYQASDVFITPSLMEARPLALAEALFNGLPAIGSDIPTISNTIEHGHNGLLAPPGDVAALENAIRKMIEQPVLRAECSKNSLGMREQFNRFDDMVMEYVDYYGSIISAGRTVVTG